jgi:hypothetical protein
MAARKNPKKLARPSAGAGVGDREFTVVLEDLRSQFNVFGEALRGQRESIEALRENMEERFALVDRRFDQVDRRFEKVESELGLVKTAVIEHSHELRELRTTASDHGRLLADHGHELREIRVTVTRIDGALANKVDRGEVEAIVERSHASR